MPRSATELAELLPATECGSTCAVAGKVQRDLQDCADRYAALFPSPPFDPAFFSTIALANTFCAPWLPAEALLPANRVTLWNFGVDRMIDTAASSRSAVQDIVDGCLAVLEGGSGTDPVTRFLAELCTQMADLPAYPRLGSVWRDELCQVLACMAREWEWRAARHADPATPLPSLAEYLDNARFGFSLVFVTHWMATVDSGAIGQVVQLQAAGIAVERVIRLLNDFATYPRDVESGDLNALKLVSRAEAAEQISVLVQRCRELLQPLRAGHAPLVLFLERHIEFNTGFYRVTDYQAPL